MIDYGRASAGERTFSWQVFSAAACFLFFLSNLQEIFVSRESIKQREFPAYSSHAKYENKNKKKERRVSLVTRVTARLDNDEQQTKKDRATQPKEAGTNICFVC